jgi:hypothetical protein
MRYAIRVSSVLWNCSLQGRFILLHDPYKVNLDEADFMILAIAEPTKECGFRAFFGRRELSALWIVDNTRRSFISFPQITNAAE